MSVVTLEREDHLDSPDAYVSAPYPAPPPGPRSSPDRWTVEDLEQFNRDNQRSELYDGMLVMSPTPIPIHQIIAGELYSILREACPKHLRVFGSPIDYQPTPVRSLEPDVCVVRKDSIGEKRITEPLTLAVEILSPSTRLFDLGPKKDLYAESGVEHYWIIDPESVTFTAFKLGEDGYEIIATAKDDVSATLTEPFPVTITPSVLLDRD